MKQLRYTGMVEAIRVRRQGYSFRPFFSDFVREFHGIAYKFTEEVCVCVWHCCVVVVYLLLLVHQCCCVQLFLLLICCCCSVIVVIVVVSQVHPSEASCKRIMERAGIEGWKLGKARVSTHYRSVQ